MASKLEVRGSLVPNQKEHHDLSLEVSRPEHIKEKMIPFQRSEPNQTEMMCKELREPFTPKRFINGPKSSGAALILSYVKV